MATIDPQAVFDGVMVAALAGKGIDVGLAFLFRGERVGAGDDD